MRSKSMKESFSVLAQMVLPMQANPAGNVHGGEIMKMMDSAAGVAAQKHAHTNCVTARVEELNFKKPVLVGELVTCKSQVIYAGHSSMEVFVTVESEDLITGKRQIALTAFFTMVSLDKNGKPSPIPPLTYDEDNAYEGKLYKEGEKRYKSHNERKS
ncbi:MAG: acyl-CoA thioesterase [Firmicutes bacterium]|nr:acyl-CoA thioesterase [Bacillota bacterium]